MATRLTGSADLFEPRWDAGLPGGLAVGRRPAFGLNTVSLGCGALEHCNVHAGEARECIRAYNKVWDSWFSRPIHLAMQSGTICNVMVTCRGVGVCRLGRWVMCRCGSSWTPRAPTLCGRRRWRGACCWHNSCRRARWGAWEGGDNEDLGAEGGDAGKTSTGL